MGQLGGRIICIAGALAPFLAEDIFRVGLVAQRVHGLVEPLRGELVLFHHLLRLLGDLGQLLRCRRLRHLREAFGKLPLLGHILRQLAQHFWDGRRELRHVLACLLDRRLNLLSDLFHLLLQGLQVLRHLLGLAILIVAGGGLLALVHLVFQGASLLGVGRLLGGTLLFLRIVYPGEILGQIFELRLGGVPGIGVLLRRTLLRSLL